ncbi:acyl carrier protein [Methylolobus aquaticus]|uniref:phosphopantetheine-binding protein n=1 Tax=Methylotetracoccus oryzae TaxID=1919059 RepID=UPI00102169A2|nr:phosphopantetheine-binding protein [Methylotetracoccus oryzae]RYU56959.1 acyl carrier protein [Methylolobus aquaticus]
MSPLELELARLIVATLGLEVDAESIDPKAPLYGEGLGLDSIDMLELSVAIKKSYGFQIRSEDPDTVRTFASLRNLAETVEQRRIAA